MLPLRKIVCPTDFSQPSYESLKSCIELAAHFGSEVSVVHVVQSVPRPSWALQLYSDPEVYEMEIADYEQALKENAQRKLEEVVQHKIPKEITSKFFVGHGDVAEEIVRFAGEESADLITIATHGLTGWRHLVFGSVTEKVLRLADCPVLTIRAPKP